MSVRSRVLFWLFLVLGLLAAARGLFELLWILPWVFRGSMDSDVSIYFVVGRGMLNGLLPYVDLFEMKPPGMFLLAALSLLVTGDQRFLGYLIIVTLCLFASIPALYAWHASRMQPWSLRRATIVIVSLCAGLLLTLYLERWATGMETEIFGGLFGGLYALSILWKPKRYAVGLVARALLLLCVIGLKEYYLLITGAVALLLTEDGKDFVRTFLLPLALAACLGVVLLLLLGSLSPYLFVYLPVLFGHRIEQQWDHPSPIMLGIDVFPLFYHLVRQFTSSKFFILFVAGLFALVPALRLRMAEPKRVLLLILAFACAMLFLWQVVPALIMLDGWRQGELWGTNRFFSVWVLIAAAASCIALLSWQWRSGVIAHFTRSMLALFLVMFAVGNAGYAGNHFAAIVPVYVALVLLAIRFAMVERTGALSCIIAAVVILAVLPYRTLPDHWGVLEAGTGRTKQAHVEELRRLDGLMDSCGFERYRALERPLDLALSRHSPWGPLITFDINWHVAFDHPLVQQTDQHLSQESQFLLAGTNIAPPFNEAVVRQYFTTEPPECAKPFLPIGTSTAWFRKGM